MIKNVVVTNHLGESSMLELRFPEKSGFLIREIEGLTPGKADIITEEVLTNDGSIFNSSRVNARNIVFTLIFMEKPTIETIRQKSYKFFPIKRRVKIRVETDNRIAETFGYVESNSPNIFSNQEGTIISIVCPDAYLYAIENQITVFNTIAPLFEFPFSNESLSEKLILFGNMTLTNQTSILYEGDAPVGLILYIHFSGPVTGIAMSNPVTLEYMNIDESKMSGLIGATFLEGDDVIISTIKGDKFITLQRAGVAYNIQNTLDKDADWFQLEKGENIFTYTATTGVENLHFVVENPIAYEGI